MSDLVIKGHSHPLIETLSEAVDHFLDNGFEVALGTEIEHEWYNFDFLRIPKSHPARDTQDTFWVSKNEVLRTHTTSIQGHITKDQKIPPPLKIVSPGRVYRNETTDQSHEAVFHQMDGFVIAENINMGHLFSEIDGLITKMLGNVKRKFYPHNFRYVEPGMEAVINWKGDWMEIMGCGMIHPEVIENMGLDKQRYTGYAFGFGVDRLAMLKYNLKDVRDLYRPDMRTILQF